MAVLVEGLSLVRPVNALEACASAHTFDPFAERAKRVRYQFYYCLVVLPALHAGLFIFVCRPGRMLFAILSKSVPACRLSLCSWSMGAAVAALLNVRAALLPVLAFCRKVGGLFAPHARRMV